MVTQALEASLKSTGEQGWGDYAGSYILQLAEDRGVATEVFNVYDVVIHTANLTDILVSAIRKPTDAPWAVPEPVQNWTSGCFLSPDGQKLRRLVLVSNWSDARHYAECRSWYTLGEIAHYNLPMQMVVLVIGQERSGKRHGPWTQGFLHPMNKALRFRKKSRSTSEVFNDKWEKVWREDRDEIPREKWLECMLKDDVLPDVCFKVDVPVLPERQRQRIKDLASRQLERIAVMTEKPEVQFSTCDYPRPCPFKMCCHSLPEREPSKATGFVSLNKL